MQMNSIYELLFFLIIIADLYIFGPIFLVMSLLLLNKSLRQSKRFKVWFGITSVPILATIALWAFVMLRVGTHY